MATTISPELARQRLIGDEPITIIDTRTEDSFTEWHIPGSVNVPFKPGDKVDLDTAFNGALDEDAHIVTVCAFGQSSFAFAEVLTDAGVETVEVIQDGMIGWSQLYEVAAVPTAIPTVEIYQLQRVSKGCLGYVIGAPEAGEAVVVDPTQHHEEYERLVADDELTITAVIDTHLHADHISGGPALADATDATYYLPAPVTDRNVERPYTPLSRNEVITVGDVEIKGVHTPGHTTEQFSLLVGSEALLTADAVFVDGVGRTELQADARAGAEALFDSIHRTVLAMPDPVQILPGHFNPETTDAIRNTGSPIHATVRDLRTGLPLLQRDRSGFVDAMTDSVQDQPPNYERIVAINRGLDDVTDAEEARTLELGPNRCAAHSS